MEFAYEILSDSSDNDLEEKIVKKRIFRGHW